MKAKSIIITTILVILAIISVVYAGLTLYGVDIVEETKSLLNITTNAQSVSFKTKEIKLPATRLWHLRKVIVLLK